MNVATVVAATNPLGSDPGLSVNQYIKEVYHVTGIELVTDAGLDPFFYWEDDSTKAWTDRLKDKGARIKVSYINGGTKEFSVEEALKMNPVWYNEAPVYSTIDIPFGVKGVQASATSSSTYPTGLPHARNRDPKITLNYRGGTTSSYGARVYQAFGPYHNTERR